MRIKKRYSPSHLEAAYLRHELKFSQDEIDAAVKWLNGQLHKKIRSGEITEDGWEIRPSELVEAVRLNNPQYKEFRKRLESDLAEVGKGSLEALAERFTPESRQAHLEAFNETFSEQSLMLELENLKEIASRKRFED